MKNKEIKRLNRMELIDIIYELEKENEALKAENEELKIKAEERRIAIEEAGSIADASIMISEILQKAQEAADLYLENIRANAEAMQKEPENEIKKEPENGENVDEVAETEIESEPETETKVETETRSDAE